MRKLTLTLGLLMAFICLSVSFPASANDITLGALVDPSSSAAATNWSTKTLSGKDWISKKDYDMFYAYVEYDKNADKNAWLFSPNMTLEKGKGYIISFEYKAQGTKYPESLKVYMGTTRNCADYNSTNCIREILNFNNTTMVSTNNLPDGKISFAPAETGTYVLAVQACSPANMYTLTVQNFAIAEDPEYEPDPEPVLPYSTQYTSKKYLFDWSIFSESDSENVWTKGADGLSVVCNAANAPAYDFWAVSPKFHFVPGDYSFEVDVNASDNLLTGQEILDFVLADAMPTAATATPFKTFYMRGSDDYVNLNDGVYVYENKLKAKFTVTTEGDYCFGIFDRSQSNADSKQWKNFNVTGVSIKDWEPEVAEWEEFRLDAAAKTVTAKGNYPVVLKNGGATVTIDGTTYPLTATCRGFYATMTGFPELNGDITSATLTIPASAFETEGGTGFPAATSTFDIDFDVRDNLIAAVTMGAANKSFTIALDNAYATVEKTDHFSLVVNDMYGNFVANLNDAALNVAESDGVTTLSFTLPKLADGWYYVALAPMSLRAKVDADATWVFNSAKTTPTFEISSIFTVNGVRYIPTGADEARVLAPASGKYSGAIVLPDVVSNAEGESFKVTEIDDKAFSQATITSITFPKNLKKIGAQAFYNCNKLTSLVLPYGIETISDRAFYYANGVNSAILPSTLISVAENAFNYPKNGLTIYTDMTYAQWQKKVNSNAFGYYKNYVNLIVAGGEEGYFPVDDGNGYGFKSVNGINMVFGDEPSCTITDGYNYICRKSAGNPDMTVTYNRDFSGFENTWQVLFVPHAINASSLNGKVAQLSRVYVENGTRFVEWKVVTGTLDANKPYLFKPAAGGRHAMKGNGVVSHTNVGSATEECDDFEITLTGVYDAQPMNVGDGKYYMYSDGNFHPAGVASTLKPFRVFLTINEKSGAQAPKQLYNVLNDGTDTPTAIGELPVEVLKSGVYYDLQGREVQNPERGIYILNGRKVVIK